jgi:hypothetical protein
MDHAAPGGMNYNLLPEGDVSTYLVSSDMILQRKGCRAKVILVTIPPILWLSARKHALLNPRGMMNLHKLYKHATGPLHAIVSN